MSVISSLRSSVRSRDGFTLVEIVVVIAIVGVLAGLSIRLFGFLKSTTFDANVQEVLANLRQVQSQARTVNGNQEYGMSFSANGWTTFSNNPTTGVQTNITTKNYSGTTIATSFNPAATQVIFSRLTGQTKNAASGTVTISITNPTKSRVIQINSSGVVYVQ